MKIIISGSLGNISKPLTIELVAAGHQVTVISHNQDRKPEIEALGATAAIGSVTDAEFLTNVFTGADAVYAMTPPALGRSNVVESTIDAGKAYATAFKNARTPRVVMLSSIGADQPDKNGPIKAIHAIENIYREIENTAFVFLRAGYFYYNFYNDIPLIQNAGIAGANFPADLKFPLVHPQDIATAAAAFLQSDFTGKEVHYIVSTVRTPKEIAATLGAAVGKPELPWVEFTDEQSIQGMTGAGLPAGLAELFTEMGAGYRSGKLLVDYEKSGSPVNGKVKLEDFAKEFAGKFLVAAV